MSSEWEVFVEEFKRLDAVGQRAKWQQLTDEQRQYLTAIYGLKAPERRHDGQDSPDADPKQDHD